MKTWHLFLLLFVGFMATWCIVDWIYVRAYQEGKSSGPMAEWALIVFLPLAGAAAFKKKKDGALITRLGISLLTALIFGGVALAWIFVFGIRFHFWIGGQL